MAGVSAGDDGTEDGGDSGRGGGGGEPPLPVGTLGAGGVDAGLTAQMQPVGQRND